jgi:hypothetical protein
MLTPKMSTLHGPDTTVLLQYINSASDDGLLYIHDLNITSIPELPNNITVFYLHNMLSIIP